MPDDKNVLSPVSSTLLATFAQSFVRLVLTLCVAFGVLHLPDGTLSDIEKVAAIVVTSGVSLWWSYRTQKALLHATPPTKSDPPQ